MREVDQDFLKKRMRLYYDSLFPIPAISPEDFKEIRKILDPVDPNKSLLLFGDRYDLRGHAFFYLFFRYGEQAPEGKKYANYYYLSLRKAMDIYVGKDLDFASLLHLDYEYLLLSAGYYESHNKRLADVMLDLLSQQFYQGKKMWIFYLLSEEDFSQENQFKKVHRFFKENQLPMVDLGSCLYKHLQQVEEF